MSTVESLPGPGEPAPPPSTPAQHYLAGCNGVASREWQDGFNTAAALASQPKDGELLALADEMERAFNSVEPIDLDAFADRLRTLASRLVSDEMADDALFSQAEPPDEHAMLIDYMGMGTEEKLPLARHIIKAAIAAALQPSGEVGNG